MHAPCGSRIGLVRRCPTCAREVPLEEIERAHEVTRDDYVVLTQDELAIAAGTEPAGTINLTHIVAPDEIDLSLVEKSYWVAPAGPSARAFALLCETLTVCRRVAIVTAKLRTRMRTAMLRPRGALLSLSLLHFSDEIVSAEALPVPATAAIGDSECKLALDLVGHLPPTSTRRSTRTRTCATSRRPWNARSVRASFGARALRRPRTRPALRTPSST